MQPRIRLAFWAASTHCWVMTILCPSLAKGLPSQPGGVAEDRGWVACLGQEEGGSRSWPEQPPACCISERHLFVRGLTSSHVKLFIHSYFWLEERSSRMCPASLTVPTEGPPFQLHQASQHLAAGTGRGHNSSSMFISFHFSSSLGQRPAEMFFAKIIVLT